MGFFAKLFGMEKYSFGEVLIKRTVVEEIAAFAKANYPKEFSAFLNGRIKDNKLVVEGIIYQNFQSSENSSVITANLPLLSGNIGTVHSHPGPRNLPSRADLQFFSKYGNVNLIIGRPYTAESIAAYDGSGRRIDFNIV